MAKKFWLVKQEPEDYSWDDFVRDKGTAWTGVRSFPARLNLRGMAVGDAVLYYHSGKMKAVVGIAEVAKAAYPDPTATEEGWDCVDLIPLEPLEHAVSLATIKRRPSLAQIALVRQSRLSVMPLKPAEFREIVSLSRKAAA